MSEPSNSGVTHLDPTKDKFGLIGIALAAEDHNASEIMDFYHRSGVLPDVHPVVLYEIKSRETEGHKLSRALVSLPDGFTLNLGTHLFYVTNSTLRPRNPSESDIESARRTLEIIGVLQYEATTHRGDGIKIRVPVHVTRQIDDLLGLHANIPKS